MSITNQSSAVWVVLGFCEFLDSMCTLALPHAGHVHVAYHREVDRDTYSDARSMIQCGAGIIPRQASLSFFAL